MKYFKSYFFKINLILIFLGAPYVHAFGGSDGGGAIVPNEHIQGPYKFNCQMTITDFSQHGPRGTVSESTLKFVQTDRSGYFTSKIDNWDRSNAAPSQFYSLEDQSLSFQAIYRNKVPKAELYLILKARDPKTHLVISAEHNDSFDWNQKVIESTISLNGYKEDANGAIDMNAKMDLQLNMTVTCTTVN